jgi:hypothetical protein
MDRLFRLFREDQLMCMRQALEDADSPTPSGPRPIVFSNVRPEGYDFDRGNAPFFKLGFDVPAKVRKDKDMVCTLPCISLLPTAIIAPFFATVPPCSCTLNSEAFADGGVRMNCQCSSAFEPSVHVPRHVGPKHVLFSNKAQTLKLNGGEE